jgi:hypothetical protein
MKGLAVGACLLLPLCLAGDVTRNANVDAFFMYRTGAVFTYDTQSEGKVTYRVLPGSTRRRIKVEVSDYLHQGKTLRTYESRGNGFFLVRNDYASGNVMDMAVGLPMLAPGLPKGTRRTWTFKGRYAEQDLGFEIELTFMGMESVTVPAGTFNCMRIRSLEKLVYPDEAIPSFRNYYYSRGVGMVKLTVSREKDAAPYVVYKLSDVKR